MFVIQMDKVFPYDYSKVSLRCLGPKTLESLKGLNENKKIKTNEGNYNRDWRGIMELCGLENEDYQLTDKPSDFINFWQRLSSDDYQAATVENLLLFLGIIDRFDVRDDILETISELYLSVLYFYLL